MRSRTNMGICVKLFCVYREGEEFDFEKKKIQKNR